MTNPFQKATRKKTKLRCALTGPTGSGKTYSALAIAGSLGKKIAVIDTEHGSASKYDHVCDFDVLELTTYEPAKYIKAMEAAADAGYDVLVVDSLSHAWFAEGGILDQKDKKSSGNGNDWTAWKTLTPQQDALTSAILSWPGHIICTMRSKMERVQEKGSDGKTTIKKVGMAPVQRDGIEYEFDVIGEMDGDHTLSITKTRCDLLDGASIRKPGKALAKTLLGWLDQGIVEAPAAKADPEAAAKAQAEAERLRAEEAAAAAAAKIAEEKTAADVAAKALEAVKAKDAAKVVCAAIEVELARLGVGDMHLATRVCAANGGPKPRTLVEYERVLAVLKAENPSPATTTEQQPAA